MHLGRFGGTVGQAEIGGQRGGESGAPGRHPQPAFVPDQARDAMKILVAFGVEYRGGGRAVGKLAGRFALAHVQPVGAQELPHARGAHRLKQIPAVDAVLYALAVHPLAAVARDAVDVRIGGRKRCEVLSGGVQHGLNGRTDVPAQTGIGLDVQVGRPPRADGGGDAIGFMVSVPGGTMARFGVDDDHVGPGRFLAQARADGHLDGRPALGKLNAGIKRAGNIIRNHDEACKIFHFCFILEHMCLHPHGFLSEILRLF